MEIGIQTQDRRNQKSTKSTCNYILSNPRKISNRTQLFARNCGNDGNNPSVRFPPD